MLRCDRDATPRGKRHAMRHVTLAVTFEQVSTRRSEVSALRRVRDGCDGSCRLLVSIIRLRQRVSFYLGFKLSTSIVALRVRAFRFYSIIGEEQGKAASGKI